MLYQTIVLVGESGSGKSSIENVLAKKYGYHKIISYTTRPPRNNEINGIDYHFITEDEFKDLMNKNFFAEVAKYRNWYYGTPINDYKKDNMIAVLTPHGLRQIKRNDKLQIISFYINVPRRDRLIKILQRGDDIEECYRRNLSDVGQFDGIEDEVNYVIHNEGYKKTPEELADEIVKLIKCIEVKR